MKTITAAQFELLDELGSLEKVKKLPLAILEKDILVTEVLFRLASLQVKHSSFSDLHEDEIERIDTGFHLVFCGGTCLSKAHKIINRMSEDIDIKFYLDDVPGLITSNSGKRKRSKALYTAILEMFNGLDYKIDETIVEKRNAYNYIEFPAEYKSRFAYVDSIAQKIKLELIQRKPLLQLEENEIGFLYEEIAGEESSRKLVFPCVSVEETLAEKVLSFLRRVSFSKTGKERSELSPTLVRHIYDVHCIVGYLNNNVQQSIGIFQALVENDISEYKAQNPAFSDTPKQNLLDTLQNCLNNPELIEMYKQKVVPLIYSDEVISYQDAFETFHKVSTEMIDSLARDPSPRAAMFKP